MYELRQQLCKEAYRLRPLLMNTGVDITITLNQPRRINALSARKPHTRFRRIPLCVKGDGDRWAARLRTHVLLALRKSLNDECGAARCADGAHSVIGEAMLIEHIARQPLQIREQQRHDMCRNFLRTNLEQQIPLHAFPSFLSIG